jgi:protein-disulfide isomerase
MVRTVKHSISVRIVLLLFLTALLLGLATAGWHFRTSEHETGVSNDPALATIGNQPITLREVEQTVALPLYLLERQRHQLLQQTLQRLIDERLLHAEASRKGLSMQQLLDEASQSESIARLANLPMPVKRLTGEGSSPDLQEQARIRQALLVSLRRQADIRTTLPDLKPPVLPVSTEGDRRLGPDEAPITIVEFSDFQCPYCQVSVKVLKDLRQLYGERIRLVYRDYLGSNHPYALQAAEAARCAGEQNRFWAYHDLLFDRQSPGKGWDFLSLANELGLEQHAFQGCLQSGRYRVQIMKDLEDGLKLGVMSTPTFFVNGRPLVGAQPLTEFQALIDNLLAHQLSF